MHVKLATASKTVFISSQKKELNVLYLQREQDIPRDTGREQQLKQSHSYNLKIPIKRGEKVVLNTVFPVDLVLGSEIHLNKFDQI